MNPELCSAVPTLSSDVPPIPSGFPVHLGLEQHTAAYAAYTTDGFYVPPRRVHVSQVDRTFRSTAAAHQRLAEGKQLDIGSDLAVEVKANADLEARLRMELDAARAHLAERTKAYHQLQTFARAKCDELQVVVEAAAQEKAVLMRDQEALRRESAKLKQLVGDVVRKARAGFAQLRAKLDEARAAGGAAETTGEAAETGEAHLVVPHEQITPSPPAAATPQSLALVAVLTPRPTPAPLEPAVIPIPDTDDPQYLPELRCTPVPPNASVDGEEGAATLPADGDCLAARSESGSTFYTWDPPQPRKRRRVEFNSSSTESDSDSDGGTRRRRRRRRRTPNERSSPPISMGPAFPIPRELNFDVKTLTSPVNHFMEIRRRRLG